MSVQNINAVVLSGNLTKDPELRHTTGGGMAIVEMRLAVNGRKKTAAGEWVDDPNFFNVTVFGKQGENCVTYLAKGRPIMVSGRLNWREWEKDGNKRQAVDVIADSVQFLGGKEGRSDSDGEQGGHSPAPSSTADDDIPF
jgi:single-strand DNA-binding protein